MLRFLNWDTRVRQLKKLVFEANLQEENISNQFLKLISKSCLVQNKKSNQFWVLKCGTQETGEIAYVETTIEDPELKEKINLLKSLGH